MRFRAGLLAAAALSGTLIARATAAQTPLDVEVLLHDRSGGSQGAPSLSYLVDGSLLAVWSDGVNRGPLPEDGIRRSRARRFDAQGSGGEIWTIERNVNRPNLLARGSQGLEGFWVFSYWSDRIVQPTAEQFRGTRFSLSTGAPLGPPIDLGIAARTSFLVDAASNASEDVAIAWLEYDLSAPPPCCRTVAVAKVVDHETGRLSSPIALEPGAGVDNFVSGLASLPDGSFVAALEIGAGSDFDIFVQRFSSLGGLLGGPVPVNTFTAGYQVGARMAASPDGSFAVVWQSALQDGSFEGIYGQRFAADGSRIGGEFRVNRQTLSAQRYPDIAMDPHGNFVVVWQTYNLSGVDDWNIRARLFRADGTPVSGDVPVTVDPQNEENPRVAFGPQGSFTVAWESARYDPEFLDVVARRFLASVGSEPCLASAGHVRCDAGGTGGDVELDQELAWLEEGSTVLAGDLNGDGREDLCGRLGNRWRCDLGHNGSSSRFDLRFGVSGDVPLIGDLDGDGREDPCVWRQGVFLCDRAHDGGAHDFRLRFGLRGDVPLIGDLDGDGRQEACVYRRIRHVFLCDLGHNGGAAELEIAFEAGGGVPLLADVDGDGKADPCVAAAGRFLCDTAHDGGAPEYTLSFSAAGQPFLANLDGL